MFSDRSQHRLLVLCLVAFVAFQSIACQQALSEEAHRSSVSATGVYPVPGVGDGELAAVAVDYGIGALRALAPERGRYYLLGYHTRVGDGGGGLFRGVTGAAEGTYVDNGGTVIVPIGGKGTDAFHRVYTSPVNVRWFGAIGDGETNDFMAIQSAFDTVGREGGGELFIPRQPGSYYRTTQALRFRYPGVRVVLETPETRIHNTGNEPGLNKWPNYGAVLLGTYTTNNIGSVASYVLRRITRNADKVILEHADNADNFAVGDVIFIEAPTTYRIGRNNFRPTWGQMNVVTSVDSGNGVLELRHPLQNTGPANIKNLSNPNTPFLLSDGTDTGEENFAARDCAIIGGWWSTERDEAPFSGGGGMIDCEIKLDRVTARSGVAYGNLIAYSHLSVNQQETRKSGTELAYCSHDNLVEIVNSEQKDQSVSYSAPGGGVWINEGSRNNLIKIKTLNCRDFSHRNAVMFQNASGNRVEIERIFASAVTEALIQFKDGEYKGERPNCEGNFVTIGEGVGGRSSYYIKFKGNGQGFRNTVSGGSFFGMVGKDAIFFDGNADNHDLVVNPHFENGGVQVGKYSTNQRVVSGIKGR